MATMNKKHSLFGNSLIAISLASLLATSSCSTGPQKPNFFPNDYYRKVGSYQAESDTAQCMAMADEYVQDPAGWQSAAKSGLGGAVVGAGVGAIGGVITKGSVGRTTAAGAAIGSLIGVVSALSESGQKSPNYKQFVDACLRQKGYETAGWN